MALSSSFLRILGSSQLGAIRYISTLTTPKLFISGLSRLTTDEKLKEAFSPFGRIVDAKVITDRVSGRSKGFGFITYTSIEEAENAKEGMNAKFLDGWVIFVDPAKPKEPRPSPQPRTSETVVSHQHINTSEASPSDFVPSVANNRLLLPQLIEFALSFDKLSSP
ncbi:hypothetical protein G4B88_027620 [Cannabis sativa]|uniref:RRM domain-containing protein n=1 Tax=Cannabis sativa TaxID=3483 RepID=A0A7J6GEK3_CANSA|nr:hypothetical protein G4B88_027620 [Cannabis sativa]